MISSSKIFEDSSYKYSKLLEIIFILSFAKLGIGFALLVFMQTTHKSQFLKVGQPILIAGLLAVLGMMILPISTGVLDFLLAINIVGALTILLISISISDPIKITTFPSLLMVATLYRLGLNISSTRMILSTGDGGQIIQTFSEFATNGNLLVGFTMFLILTLIQFIVIAKGSERVAEVAARFTLDALPGKQMSIDADLRAGLITQEQAQKQRKDLHRESKFFGALDGAMKFVKGDAIAGLLITAINLFGGFIAGVMQQGLTIQESLSTYSLLTIGDGLVSQIPALLMAITAGFVITRVSDHQAENSLGHEIGMQVMNEPKALIVAGIIALFVGFVPGFPFFLFLIISILLIGVGSSLLLVKWKKSQETKTLDAYLPSNNHTQAESLLEVFPLALEVSPKLFNELKSDSRWQHCLETMYPKLTYHLTQKTGILYPELRLKISLEAKEIYTYKVLIYDVPVDEGKIHPRHCALVGGNTDESITPDQTDHTVHGTPLALWNLKNQHGLLEKGMPILGPEEVLLRHLVKVLQKHGSEFIDIQASRRLLDQAENHYAELVKEVIPRMMSIQKLTEILKRLAEEQIPLKDFRLILQVLANAQPENHDPVSLTEKVRMGLKRAITYQHTKGKNQLSAFTVSSTIEDKVRSAIHQADSETYLALSPEDLTDIQAAFQETMNHQNYKTQNYVVLTSPDVRRFIKKVIDVDFPDVSVLSFKEIDSHILINTLGEVSEEIFENTNASVISA